jgi:uncharacterized membrane protein YqiK
MMGQLYDIGMIILVILALFACLGFMAARLYQRSTKEMSFVRTGFLGQKVILNGGCFVLPVLHEIIHVNMNTLRLEVRRAAKQALITKDRMRVDVTAEFYVRVKPESESIAIAAQTLGRRTLKPELLKELVEGKFVDALRSVAAEMEMEQLHEKRAIFVQSVQKVVSEDLGKNGLELESVSLTGLDQTDKEHFNPDNAFDAQGLTKLTEEIESRRKRRNEIEQDTNVSIRTKNLEAKRQQLEIEKEQTYAELEQQREIQIREAGQMTEIATQRAEKKREADEAEILARQRVDLAGIEATKRVAEETIAKEQAIKEKEIHKHRVIEQAEIEKAKTVEIATQDKEIALAEKSKEKSEAQAQADKARALAVKEEEAVVTVRETAKAERTKAVQIVKASEDAEKDAVKVKIEADAKKTAAIDIAAAARTRATGDADSERIQAQGSADATKLKAEAAACEYEVDAAGKRALNDAANLLSEKMIAMQVRLALIEQLPEIIRESVKPMERIEAIKILQVNGLTGGTNGGGGEHRTACVADGAGDNLAEQVVQSALQYRAHAPLIDSLLADIGINTATLNGLSGSLGKQAAEPPKVPKIA